LIFSVVLVSTMATSPRTGTEATDATSSACVQARPSPLPCYDVEPVIQLLQSKATALSPLAAAPFNADHWTKPWRPVDSDSAKLEEELLRQFLCSKNARTAIAALKLGPTNTIDRVPLDQRPVAEEIFHDWLASTPVEKRRPLLGTAAARGTGKSVMLAFDMAWFREHRGGLPIEVTFNDDQSKLSFATLDHSPSDEDKRQFEGDVAIRVLDRALAACGLSGAVRQRLFSRNRDAILASLDEVSTAALEKGTVDSLYLLPALAVTRRLLGAPEDTEVFLVVDEIGKCVPPGAKHEASIINSLASHLCTYYDADPRLFLALSTYGATNISTLATDSTRPLKLQPLPPVFPVTSLLSNAVGQLPPVLRRFASPERRCELPGGPHNYELYATISRILLNTGGHPRSVGHVFLHLCDKFPKNVDELPADGFCTALRTAIDGGIERACKTVVDGFSCFTGSIIVDHLEDLARDTACEFAFPTIKGHHHEAMLVNTCKGLCQFISPSTMVGHAFIPYPVLVRNYHGGGGPCAQALALVAAALKDYSNVQVKGDIGKAFEKLALGSFLLYLRANQNREQKFLGAICRRSGAHSSTATIIQCSGDVELWEHIQQFPSTSASTRQDLVDLVCRLEKLPWTTAGAMFMPTDPVNPAADVFGLFRTGQTDEKGLIIYSLVVIQCKDWLFARANVVDVWRKAQKLMRHATPATQTGPDDVPLRFNLPNAVVDVHYVLFTSNLLQDLLGDVTAAQQNVAAAAAVATSAPTAQAAAVATEQASVSGVKGAIVMEPHESALDLKDLSMWLPTAGLNAQAAHHLRQLFCCDEKVV
jgi:hypothetical protein